MKIAILFLVLINYIYAVKDIVFKPISDSDDYISRKILFREQSAYYPELLTSKIYEDDKNIFLYSKHFRVIYGKNYKDDQDTIKLAKDMLDIAEFVWEKEVDNLGFRMPLNMNTYYMDIYIANRDTYNQASSSYVNISSSYAGFTENYSNNMPFITINPTISSGILEVTLAHEFFHAIQFAYGFYNVSDEIWYDNIWFLEASAVMMEDEVYDDVNDYINYLSYYLNSSYKPLEEYDGWIEYGKVIFVKYLKERYSMDFIKTIFKKYNGNQNILQDIIKDFADANMTFDKAYSTYAVWLNELENFKDGYLYPSVKKYNFSEKLSIGYCGIELINKDINENQLYLYGSNLSYTQETLEGYKNIADDINTKGLIVINKTEDSALETDLLKNNIFKGFQLKKGWNLCGNIFDKELSLQEILKDKQIAWLFEDGRYYGFSNDSGYEQKIESLGYKTKTPWVKRGKGFWIYSPEQSSISVSYPYLSQSNKDDSTWNLITFNSVSSPNQIDNSYDIIWQYRDNWQYYSPKYDFNITKIKLINPGVGYFIR